MSQLKDSGITDPHEPMLLEDFCNKQHDFLKHVTVSVQIGSLAARKVKKESFLDWSSCSFALFP